MTRHTIALPANLEEFRLRVQAGLRTSHHAAGDWLPFAVRHDTHGELITALIDPRAVSTTTNKELLAVELAHWMSQAPRFVAVGFSAWTAPYASSTRPSAHPGREEVLILTTASSDEAPRTFMSPIRRTPNSSPVLGTWIEATAAAGLFVDAIRCAFIVASRREELVQLYGPPPESQNYLERRALARVLGVDPLLVQEEPWLKEAA